MFCKQLSLRGIERSWLGSRWKTFVSMRVPPCAWSPAFYLGWETVRIKRLLPAVWKCFKSLRASAWACSLGRLSSAGEGEWRWQVVQAVQVEGSGGKKSKQALLLHHCLHAFRTGNKFIPQLGLLMAACSGSLLWENLYWTTRNVVEWRRYDGSRRKEGAVNMVCVRGGLCILRSWDLPVLLPSTRVHVTITLHFLFSQSDRRTRDTELQHLKVLPQEE